MQKTEQTLVVRHVTIGVNGKVSHGDMEQRFTDIKKHVAKLV
jgi:hypothetical protein